MTINPLTTYVFYFLASITLGSGVGVVLSRKPIHSILSLVVCFFSMAGHYVLMGAHFLAMVQVIVYAGAIMVLFLFALMLLNLNQDQELPKQLLFKLAAVMAAGLMLVSLVGIFRSGEIIPMVANDAGTIQAIGKMIFQEYMLPFEISSLLFLSAMVGVVLLGKKEVNY